MTRAARPLLSLSVIALAVCVAAPAWASDRPSRQERPSRASHGHEPLADSVRRVSRETRGGRVLSAERMQSDGRDVDRIKAMDDRGRVRVYMVDPQRRQTPPRGQRPARDDNP